MILSNDPRRDARAYLRDTLIGYAVGVIASAAMGFLAYAVTR